MIDGKMDDSAWNAAPWTADFVDIEGDRKPRPRFRTRAKMLWDDKCFYVAAELEEPHVWATLKKHDSVIFRDNDFEVFIDPDGDNQNYYEIEINAIGTEWDLRLPKAYRDGGPAVNSWEIPGLLKATYVEGTLGDGRDKDGGWTVELAFPWKSLAKYAGRPAPPKPGDQWRINFSRVEWTTSFINGRYAKAPGQREDNWVWSPQWVVDMHQPQMWGYVQFEDHAAEFRKDETHRARMFLSAVYSAEKAYCEKYGRYSPSLNELDIALPRGIFTGAPRIFITKSGYVASGVVVVEEKPRTLEIREDSRLVLK